MKELEHFLSLTGIAGTEVTFSVRVPSSDEVHTVSMNLLWREIYDAIRALEKLVEQRNIPEGNLGGLGKPAA